MTPGAPEGRGTDPPFIAWLNGRVSRAPADLRTRMNAAVRDAIVTGGPASALLLEAAARCIARAVALGRDRRAALDLLAADGLLTVACDAAVEEGDAGGFARRASARLATLLPAGEA